MKRWLLLLAFATSALAADDLETRLDPFREEPEYRIHAVVYDRYASGRPRRVVAAIGNVGDGYLWLFRFPDSAKGKPRVLDKTRLGAGPAALELMRVIHPKDIVVSLLVRHGEIDFLECVIHDRLVLLSEGFGEAIDLDGDGVPENLSAAYAGTNDCGVYSFVLLQRWNGKRFVGDGRHYVGVLGIYGAALEDELLLSSSERYTVHLFGPGSVTLDGKRIEPGKAFTTKESCHTIALHDAKPNTRALLEELP